MINLAPFGVPLVARMTKFYVLKVQFSSDLEPCVSEGQPIGNLLHPGRMLYSHSSRVLFKHLSVYSYNVSSIPCIYPNIELYVLFVRMCV